MSCRAAYLRQQRSLEKVKQEDAPYIDIPHFFKGVYPIIFKVKEPPDFIREQGVFFSIQPQVGDILMGFVQNSPDLENLFDLEIGKDLKSHRSIKLEECEDHYLLTFSNGLAEPPSYRKANKTDVECIYYTMASRLDYQGLLGKPTQGGEDHA